jgi:pimeloyl-ACP methyl ester carboxylesterase
MHMRFAPEINTADPNSETPDRRAVLTGIGLAAAASAVTSTVSAAPAVPAVSNVPLWKNEYVAMKGDVKIQLYRRRSKAPVAGETPLPILIMVHGSSMSALPTFDLTVPGAGEYSMMNVFARYGYDVWAVDFEGYGRSSVTSGNSDIKSGVADLVASTAVIAKETGVQSYHLVGESSGALRCTAFAAEHPDRVNRLVLSAYTYTGKGSPTLAERAKGLEFYRTHNRRPRPKEMLESIFTRDKPGTSDPRTAAALVAAELPFGDSVPTGTYLDMTSKLPIIEANLVKAPVLLARGQHDGIATEADLLDFYHQLPNPDRQFVTLPGLAHTLVLGTNRELFWHATHSFLSMPKPLVAV